MSSKVLPDFKTIQKLAQLWMQDPAKIRALIVLSVNYGYTGDMLQYFTPPIFVGEEHVRDHIDDLQEAELVGTDRIVFPHVQNGLDYAFGLKDCLSRFSRRDAVDGHCFLPCAPTLYIAPHLKRLNATPDAREQQIRERQGIKIDIRPVVEALRTAPTAPKSILNEFDVPCGVESSVAQQLVQVHLSNSQYILILMKHDPTGFYFHRAASQIERFVKIVEQAPAITELKKRGLMTTEGFTTIQATYAAACAWRLEIDTQPANALKRILPKAAVQDKVPLQLKSAAWFTPFIKGRVEKGQEIPPAIRYFAKDGREQK